jgi:hypothetical protein
MTPRRFQFPSKMPRKMKKVVGKVFDDRRLTLKEEQLWSKAMRAATEILRQEIRDEQVEVITRTP